VKRTWFPKVLLGSFLALLVLLGVATSLALAGELDEIRGAIKDKGAKWTAGETSVSKLPGHLRQLRAALHKPEATGAEEMLAGPAPTALPGSFDWRNDNSLNYVTPVRDQGNCGSCWAFATTGALESYVLIKDSLPGQDKDCAEQILVSCSGAGSCSGGYIDRASNYIRDVGLPLETCYPYTQTNGTCTKACSDFQVNPYSIDSWAYVATLSPTVDAIKNALHTYGPLVTTMNVYTDFFYYQSGVYFYTSGKLAGGHAILIIGYDDVGKYFIVKNSWGIGWGEGGFFKIAYSQLTSKVQFGDWTIAYHQDGAPAPCAYSISPTSKTFSAADGTGTVSVTTGSGCSWTATSNAPAWLTITPGAGDGSGNGQVAYQVAQNTTRATRVGTINIAGQTFTVTQKKK